MMQGNILGMADFMKQPTRMPTNAGSFMPQRPVSRPQARQANPMDLDALRKQLVERIRNPGDGMDGPTAKRLFDQEVSKLRHGQGATNDLGIFSRQ